MENKKTAHMFRMKRIIAVAIIMALLPIIPIQAVYAECSHQNLDSARLLVDTSYERKDSSNHTAVNTYRVDCADCGSFVKWETERETEPHKFNSSGKCTKCGYERGSASCTHTKTKDVLISTYSKSNNEKTHTTYWNYNVVCKSCNEIMDSYTDYETEKHTFNSKGVCTVCNYKKGTTEENVCKVYGSAHKLSHEEFEAEHPHLIYKKCDCGYTEYTGGKKAYYSECKICNPQECPVHGKHKLDGAVMFEKEHPHRQYVVCDCGYAKYTGGNKDYYSECDICNPKECQHSSTEKKVYYDEYVAKDSQYHYHNYYYDVVCSLCGEKLKSPMGNDKEAHTFNKNDVCTLCGYSLNKPCTHQSTREELASQTAKSLNDSQHELISTYNVICKSCKEKIDTVTRTTKAAHVFDAAEDCEVCGYRKGCQHTSSKLVKIGSGYDVINASTHQYYVVYNRVCANSACGKVLEYNIIETSNQAHSFSGNKCTACGYEKAEELSVSISRNRSSATVGEYIGASAAGKGGTGSYQYAWKATCNGGTVANGSYGSDADWGTTASKAGNWVITVTLKDTNTGKTVSASTSGITVKERVCTHANTEDTLIDTKYIKQSDSTHIIRRYYSRICVDCGTVLNASFYKDKTEDHSFNASGQCVCGFTKASCKHDQGSHQEYVSSRLEQINSGNEHKKVTVYRIICDQCSATINASTEVASIEHHSFNAAGVCACGYAKPTEKCDHANRVNEQIGNPTYVINSEKVHTKTVKVRVKCADCGIELESEKISTSVEKHKFVNGICACGQKEHVHSYEKVIIGQPKYVNQNTNEHDVTITYVMKCSGCGDTTAQQTETIREAHSYTTKDRIEEKHQAGLGHATFDRCACGAVRYTGYGKYSNCCECYGHQYGDAYEENGQWIHKCLKCGAIESTIATNTFLPEEEQEPFNKDACEHEAIISYSSHPHYYIDSIKCTKCGQEFLSIGPKQQRDFPEGRFVTDCPLCFPMQNVNDVSQNEKLMISAAERYCELSQLAYDTDEYAEDGKRETSKYQVRVDHDNYPNSPDCLIDVRTSTDGKLMLNFAFEGSQGGDPTTVISKIKYLYDPSDTNKHNMEESQEDWWETDYMVGESDRGIHRGFDEATQRFINENVSIPVPESFPGLDGGEYKLKELLEFARQNPDKVSIQVTGHSLGGALAQVFTYYLVTDYRIDKNRVNTYTFASPVPFSNDTIESSIFNDMNVFNFINIRDLVPKYGVTEAESPVVSLYETAGNEMINTYAMALYQLNIDTSANSGGFVLNGSNLGYNIYLNGTAKENIVTEHLLSTYKDLLESNDTKVRIINTRDYFQSMEGGGGHMF